MRIVASSLALPGSQGGVMPRVFGVMVCAVLVLLASAGRLAAQGGVIRGRVTDSTGAALGRVSVTIEALGARATTDDQGNYELRSVPAGSHAHRVRACGHAPQLVVPLIVGGGARPQGLDGDAHAPERGPGRIGDASADDAALRGQPSRGREEDEHGTHHHTKDAGHNASLTSRESKARSNDSHQCADYGPSGLQLAARLRALHSSVGIGITLKTLSLVSSFGSPGHAGGFG